MKSYFECSVSERRPNLGGLDKVGDGKVVDCEGVGKGASSEKKKKPKKQYFRPGKGQRLHVSKVYRSTSPQANECCSES